MDSSSVRRRGQTSGKAPTPLADPSPKQPEPQTEKFRSRVRTLLALLCLWASAPILLLWALCAWLGARFRPPFRAGCPAQKLNILVTGGKMSKASAVARAVGRDGHRVFTAEILPYRYCHTRFCAYVSKHYVLPRPVEQPAEWLAMMKQIVADQSIDLIIPCTAPVESSAYAHLRESLPAHVRVFAFDGDVSDVLDNKFTFNQALVDAGLPCPETARMENLQEGLEFFKNKSTNDLKRYIVKPAVYDPAARADILFLPVADAEKQSAYLASRNASKQFPYVIQEVLSEPEYGCYATFNQGELTGFELFDSCASCLKYEQLPDRGQYEAVLALNKGLGKSMGLTGQLTLDLMHTAEGALVPIECNPRIHSAVCTLEGHPNLGALLADAKHVPSSDSDVVVSPAGTLRYWFMDQLFLWMGFWKAKNCFQLSARDMLRGTDALLHGDDPLPFLAMYLVQIPSLLIVELAAGTPWLKLDFCIGKVVKEGGD